MTSLGATRSDADVARSSPIAGVPRAAPRRVPEPAGRHGRDLHPGARPADPDWFGISVVTADGPRLRGGRRPTLPFTIQSISKPFVWGAALEDRGRDAVLERIGVEPSGNAFNAIVVDEVSNRPFNPMVNAGAIVATGLLAGGAVADRETGCSTCSSGTPARVPTIDEAVFGRSA